MRVTRAAALLSLSSLVLTCGVAGAAAKKPVPKPVCNLVLDDAGDASVLGPDPSDSSLDILSADVASDAKSFTAVLRVKSVSAGSLAATGRNYYVQITTPSYPNPIYFSYETDPTGAYYNWGELAPGTGGVGTYTSKGTATGSIVPAKNEIHITVPVAELRLLANLKPGTKVSSVHANTTAAFVVLVSTVDEADSSKAYIAGAKSCVVPGK
jgi:hypothetical protein